jgi:hypothetical protein
LEEVNLMDKNSIDLIESGAPDATVRNQNNKLGRDFELDAYSIEEFCRRHSLSRGTYYNMKETGSGPREKRAMGRVLITREAAREWRQVAA